MRKRKRFAVKFSATLRISIFAAGNGRRERGFGRGNPDGSLRNDGLPAVRFPGKESSRHPADDAERVEKFARKRRNNFVGSKQKDKVNGGGGREIVARRVNAIYATTQMPPHVFARKQAEEASECRWSKRRWFFIFFLVLFCPFVSSSGWNFTRESVSCVRCKTPSKRLQFGNFTEISPSSRLANSGADFSDNGGRSAVFDGTFLPGARPLSVGEVG